MHQQNKPNVVAAHNLALRCRSSKRVDAQHKTWTKLRQLKLS